MLLPRPRLSTVSPSRPRSVSCDTGLNVQNVVAIVFEQLHSHNDQFLPRDAMLARYMLLSFVRLSVRLSHAGIVSKRLNAKSRKQRHTIAQKLVF